LLAGRLRPGTEPTALWLTGLGSPLLFDGFQVVAHALGAGLVGLATLAALAALDDGAGRRRAGWALVAVALSGAACLARSEAVLATAALGVAVLVVGARTLRSGRRRALAMVLGGALVVVAGAVRVG